MNSDTIIKTFAAIALAAMIFAAGFFIGRQYEQKQNDHFHFRLDESGLHLDGLGQKR